MSSKPNNYDTIGSMEATDDSHVKVSKKWLTGGLLLLCGLVVGKLAATQS